MAIRNIRHKGLSLLHTKGSSKGSEAVYVNKARRTLARLETAVNASDVDLPGYKLHPLKGDRAGFWSVTLGANWRIIFRFDGADVCDVDLLDYH